MAISISGAGSFTGATNEYTFDQSVGVAGTLTYEDVTDVDAVGIITAQSGLNVGPKTGIACTISSAGAITAAGVVDATKFTSTIVGDYALRVNGKGGFFVDGSGDEQIYVRKSTINTPLISLSGTDGSIAGTGQFTSDVQVNAGGSWDFTANTKQSYIGLGEVIVKRQNGEGSSSYGFVLKRSNGAGGVDDMITMAADGSFTANGRINANDRIRINTGGSLDVIAEFNTYDAIRVYNEAGSEAFTVKSGGNVDTGDLSATGGGSRFTSDGQIFIRPADSKVATASAIQIYSGGDTGSDATITLKKNGNAEFAGSTVKIGDTTANVGDDKGAVILENGALSVMNTESNTSQIFGLYGNGSQSFKVTTGGEVTAKENILVGTFDSSSTSATGLYGTKDGVFYTQRASGTSATTLVYGVYLGTALNYSVTTVGTVTMGSYDSSSTSGFGAKIQVNANSAQYNAQISQGGASFTDMYNVYFGSTKTFQVLANGNVQNNNNSYGQISDVSLKENIVDANSQWADIKAVKVRNYNFKEGQTHKQIGVIAQEIETVSPGLVYENSDNLKGVSHSILYMKAIKALQEAMERIETLEAKVAALEGS